ncbi:MAG: hypothetical protein WCJ30_06535 [Deltaproteobacteria bacterium]
MTTATPEPVRERVPSGATKPLLVLFGIASLGCLLAALLSDLPPTTRASLAAAGVCLFALNAVIKKKLGFYVEVTSVGIREVRNGGKEILWADQPEVTLVEPKAPRSMGPRSLVLRGMMAAAQIQSLIVKRRDGLSIRVDTVFGSPLPAAVAQFCPVRRV